MHRIVLSGDGRLVHFACRSVDGASCGHLVEITQCVCYCVVYGKFLPELEVQGSRVEYETSPHMVMRDNDNNAYTTTGIK